MYTPTPYTQNIVLSRGEKISAIVSSKSVFFQIPDSHKMFTFCLGALKKIYTHKPYTRNYHFGKKTLQETSQYFVLNTFIV